MNEEFRFSLPQRAEGTSLSKEEAEKILRAQVREHEHGSQDHRNALWQLTRFLGVTGRAAEGLEILETLLESTAEPEEKAEITLGMGQLMEKMGDFEGALAFYSRGVSLEPVGVSTWYFLHNNLGFCLNQFARHDEAEKWCRVAIGIDPQRHNAHKNLALACQGLGRYVEAARSFLQSVHCEAGDPRALHHLEQLVAKHPEVAADFPDLSGEMEKCRHAVEMAMRMRAGHSTQPPEAKSS